MLDQGVRPLACGGVRARENMAGEKASSQRQCYER
jgi:hypothetical protein